MIKLWRMAVGSAAIIFSLTSGVWADDFGADKTDFILGDIESSYELKVEPLNESCSPIWYNGFSQTFFRPNVGLDEVIDINSFANTAPGVLAKFITIGNRRSAEAWKVINRESQQFIIQTMVDVWLKNNPHDKDSSEVELQDKMKTIFEDPDNKVAKVFWETYFIGIFGELQYQVDFRRLSFDGNADKEVVKIGERTFILVRQEQQWKVDLIHSELEPK
ncbi:MAG: hypothetical protein ACI376_07900 [Candidatus Bruticola sp.]